MNKVLIITYYWPPSGGAGVQRWLRFSKYLPEFGWDPVILTIDPRYAAYPTLDTSLEKDVPQGLRVARTKATDWFSLYARDKSKVPSAGFAKTRNNSLKEYIFRFIRGNFFIPDPRRGWNKFAFRKACEIIENEGIKHIITTSPPHSTQLIGLKIKSRYPAIKWIADLRDPWTDIYYYKQFYPTVISRSIDAYYEKKVLKESDTIITVGPSLKALFSSKLNNIADKIAVFTNGFDEDDFKGKSSDIPSLSTITYVGTLSEKYPIGGLLEAFGRIKPIYPDLKLRFVGAIPENIKGKILSEISGSSVEFIPYTHHDQAINYMISSTLLLLVIPEHKGNQNIITGKIFEYIASGRQVLCLGPADGDAAEILEKSNSGKCFSYTDAGNIEDFILSVLSDPVRELNVSENFSHRNIVKKMVSFLD